MIQPPWRWIMGKGYSSDLRERVYGDIESGQSRRAAARRFGVSVSTSIRLAQRMASKGSLEPEKQGRPPGGGKLAAHADALSRAERTFNTASAPCSSPGRASTKWT